MQAPALIAGSSPTTYKSKHRDKTVRNLSRISILIFLVCLLGCGQVLKRGMADNAYISTARPAISITANGMPLMAYTNGVDNLEWTGVLGGLPVEIWLAAYGTGGLAPLATIIQAQLPSGWIWDSDMSAPFSIDHGSDVFNGQTYQAWTCLINPKSDPFSNLITAVQPDGQPQQWIARFFASRYNFNQDKIILIYREPLPADISSLSALPLGRDNYLREFAQRARAAFTVGNPPANPGKVQESNNPSIRWQYLQQNFLGTVSQLDLYTRE